MEIKLKEICLSLSLALAFGLINRSYGQETKQAKSQQFYNIIKDASFEENSKFWKVEATMDGSYASNYFPDSTCDGYYVGMTVAAGTLRFRESFAELRQKFVPRIIKDFQGAMVVYWEKYKIIEDDGYKFGVTLKSKQGNEFEYTHHPQKEGEGSWLGHGDFFYDKWINAGLPETDSLEEIILRSVSTYDAVQNKRYGQEVRWDNIYLGSTRFDIDGAVLSIDSPKEAFVGQAYEPKATLKNEGALPVGVAAAANIHSKTDMTIVYTDTVRYRHVINPDDSEQVRFKEWIPEEAGYYRLELKFLVENDQDPIDNVNMQELEVKTGIDGAIMSIDSPLETKIGQVYIPKATMKNLGALPFAIKAVCEISVLNNIVYSDTVVLERMLEPDESIQLIFKDWEVDQPEGDYRIKVSSLVGDDQNPENDSKKEILTITGKGILEEKIAEIKLIKVLPSIFSTQARLYLSKGEKVRIYDPSGKLVEELHNSDRDGKIFFGSTLKPGIYFYQVEDRIGKVVKIK